MLVSLVKSIAASRFAVLKPAFFVSLPVFFIMRVVLLIKHYADIDVSFYKIIGAFHSGLLMI